jgi:hypothetical protein
MIVEMSRGRSRELYGVWDLGVSFIRSIVLIYITVRCTSPFTSDWQCAATLWTDPDIFSRPHVLILNVLL